MNILHLDGFTYSRNTREPIVKRDKLLCQLGNDRNLIFSVEIHDLYTRYCWVACGILPNLLMDKTLHRWRQGSSRNFSVVGLEGAIELNIIARNGVVRVFGN